MVYMSNVLFDVLDYIDEGIIILDNKLDILFWNNYMEYLTGTKQKEVIDTNIYTSVPSLNRSCFRNAVTAVMGKNRKFFFSAAIHKGLIVDNAEINLKVSRFDVNDEQYLIIECIDVTSQFIRINQLKEYANELYSLNRELMEKEREIEKLAYYDKLTGLANRTLFYEVAAKFLEAARRDNTILGLMFIDVDRFKGINDKYGHEIGDRVLVEVAKILTESTRANDTVVRYGGDEFLILLPGLKAYTNYRCIAARIANAKNKVKVNDEEEICISLSIGVSFYPKDGNSIDELISKADKAMYRVKNVGGNRCINY